jgi:folate-binding protein YgfZ
MRSELIELALSALKKYAVFSKVELERDESLQAIAVFGDAAIPSDCLARLQFSAIAQEVWRTRDSIKFEPQAHHQQWSLHLIQCGIAELELSETEKFLPQELRLDLIGGVSFKKGCYTGQEVVARLHYRGKLKKGLFRAQCGHRLAQVGQNIRLADQIIGKIIKVTALSESSCEMLVLANIDATHDQHCKLENGGELIRWTPFAYAIPKGT